MTTQLAQYQRSISTLIPQDYLNELMYWRDQINNGAWRIGEIANEVYTLALANDQTASKIDICSAVGMVVGKSGRTIRYYADTAAFFPLQVRREYADILPFSHFVLAKSLGDGLASSGKPLWQETLDLSVEYMAQHQVPPSREHLEHLMSGPIDERNLNTNASTPIPAGALVFDVPALPAKIGEISPILPLEASLDLTVSHVRRLLEPIPSLLERLAALRSGVDLPRLARAKVMVEEALADLDNLA